MHEDQARSGHKDSVEQLLVFARTYQKISPIAPVLHKTVGAPNCPLSAQAGITETHAEMLRIHGISAL
jgi:hypothetical protein